MRDPGGSRGARRRRSGLVLVALLAAIPALLLGCSDGSGDDAPGGSPGSSAPTTTSVERADGPAADLGEVLEGGSVVIGQAGEAEGSAPGPVVEVEHVAAGTATSYTSTGPLPADGRFELTPADSGDYRTRILVRRPERATDFNGTVVVEWLNVSGGIDANPDYVSMSEELLRGGYAWVGVSAQHIGVEGGPVAVTGPSLDAVAGKGLKALNPERYASLNHPGDAFSYDIYTQVARALREPTRGGPLGGLRPERILAVGESQSGFALTTYANGVQPLTQAFDGFLIHSRGGAAAPLGEPGSGIDITSTIFGTPTIVREDLDVPVLVLQTESDVVGVLDYLPARQEDSESFRLWEVAGAAHADARLLGPVASTVDCGAPVNDGPMHFVAKAALRALDRWVETGRPPPRAERLEVDGEGAYLRDPDGIVLGGVRTPLVDVPVDVHSGEPGPSGSVICLLLGSSTPLAGDRLVEIHGDRDGYLSAFRSSVDEAVDAGFVLREDRAALMDRADPDRLG